MCTTGRRMLSNRACMSPQRWPPQELVAWCSSLALSVVCVTERGSREHGIVPDGAADAPAAPGVVADVWDSHANVLSNRGCMAPQGWPPQELVACCSPFALTDDCLTEGAVRRLGIVYSSTEDAPGAMLTTAPPSAGPASTLPNPRRLLAMWGALVTSPDVRAENGEGRKWRTLGAAKVSMHAYIRGSVRISHGAPDEQRPRDTYGRPTNASGNHAHGGGARAHACAPQPALLRALHPPIVGSGNGRRSMRCSGGEGLEVLAPDERAEGRGRPDVCNLQ